MKTFPIIKGTDLITDTPFYQWLKTEHKAGADLRFFIETIKRYTGVEKPFVGRTDGQAHKTTYLVFWGHITKRNKVYQRKDSLLQELKTLVAKIHNGVELTKIEIDRHIELVNMCKENRIVIPFNSELQIN